MAPEVQSVYCCTTGQAEEKAPARKLPYDKTLHSVRFIMKPSVGKHSTIYNSKTDTHREAKTKMYNKILVGELQKTKKQKQRGDEHWREGRGALYTGIISVI